MSDSDSPFEPSIATGPLDPLPFRPDQEDRMDTVTPMPEQLYAEDATERLTHVRSILGTIPLGPSASRWMPAAIALAHTISANGSSTDRELCWEELRQLAPASYIQLLAQALEER